MEELIREEREKQNNVGRGRERETKTEKETLRNTGRDFTLARPGAVVRYEPSPAGVRLGRAHLTWVTPCPSHCGTAQSLCAHNACELALTHLIIHRGEARPSPVVCRGQTQLLKCVFIFQRDFIDSAASSIVNN